MIARLDVQERAEEAVLNTPGGAELQARLGAHSDSIPFFAFLNERGELIANSLRPVPDKPGWANIAHPTKPEEVDYFMDMLRKAVPALPPADAQLIETYLRNQKR